LFTVGLLLVVGTQGCAAKPHPVAEEAEQSLPGQDSDSDAAIAEIERLGGSVKVDEAGSAFMVRLDGTQVYRPSEFHQRPGGHLPSIRARRAA